MTAPPKRRWFRFGLRTMFVVVTAICVWLGWNLRIVRERATVIKEVMKVYPDQEESLGQQSVPMSNFTDEENIEFARISWIRQIMGDKARRWINLADTMDPQLIERTEEAFPEAILAVYDGKSSSDSNLSAFRYSLYDPPSKRRPNIGTIFKTGLIEK